MTKYEELARQLTALIRTNLDKGISRLPTEAQICTHYQVSRQTVRAALSLLQNQGLIVSKQGSGSYATGISENLLTNTIPILISSTQDYIYPTLLADIREQLSAYGYELRILPTSNSTSTERHYLSQLLAQERVPRGMIIEGCKSALPNPNLDLYEQLQERGTFLLFLHNYYKGLKDITYIKDDNYYGGYLLGQHLVSLGHSHIAGIFKIDDLQGPERYQGVVSGLRDLNTYIYDENVRWFTSLEAEALTDRQDTRFLTDFIKRELDGCTAVICYNDEIAYWLIKELAYAGITVPDTLSIVCFDNSYLSDLSKVRITTLSHRPHEMGTSVAACLTDKLKGTSVVSQEIPWQLVRKDSDAPCHG